MNTAQRVVLTVGLLLGLALVGLLVWPTTCSETEGDTNGIRFVAHFHGPLLAEVFRSHGSECRNDAVIRLVALGSLLAATVVGVRVLARRD